MSNKRTEEVLRKLDELRNSLYRILYRYKINPSDNDQSHTEMIGIFENDFNDIKQTIDNITWDDKSVKRFNFFECRAFSFSNHYQRRLNHIYDSTSSSKKEND